MIINDKRFQTKENKFSKFLGNLAFKEANIISNRNCSCSVGKRWFGKNLQQVCKILLYSHLLIHAEIYIYMLDTYRRNELIRRKHDNDKDAVINDTGRLLLQYITSPFTARVRKGCSRFACERELETEHKL